MCDVSESENNSKKDAIEKLVDFTNNISYGELLSIIFLIGLIISSLVTYFTRNYYMTVARKSMRICLFLTFLP